MMSDMGDRVFTLAEIKAAFCLWMPFARAAEGAACRE